MDENHQDEGESKMKTRFALALYTVAIISLVVLTGFVIWRLIIMPPCTQVGNQCVIEGWSVAGLAGTILGVAATMLAILGAVAVAAWWTELNNRVTNLVKRLYSEQVVSLNERVTDQVNLRYNEQVKEIEKKIRSEVLKHLVTKAELDHLRYLDSTQAFLAVNSGNFIPELRHLLLLNFIERQHDRGIRSLETAFMQNEQVNVKDHFHITDEGKAYLEEVKQN